MYITLTDIVTYNFMNYCLMLVTRTLDVLTQSNIQNCFYLEVLTNIFCIFSGKIIYFSTHYCVIKLC